MTVGEPQWLSIARELRAIAQTGLAFTADGFDRLRYERLRELAASMAKGSGENYEEMIEILRRDFGYATPKVDVRGAECVIREIAEESGFAAKALKLAAVRDYHKSGHPPRSIDSIYKMFFICEITGGSARASNETSDVAFFLRDALPQLSLGRTTSAQIDRMFHHAQHPELPTDFD